MSKRVLFLSYLFPPVGGVGVQRVTKLLKYLPRFGWDCSVLTVDNPSVPLFDESFGGDIPPETIIRRARTLEPGYAAKSLVSANTSGDVRPSKLKGAFKGAVRRIGNAVLQPDPQILWRPGALHEGFRLLMEIPHDVIVATGPPFSTFLLGATLSKRTGVPLVLDYRDEWDISNAYWENKRQGRLLRALQQWMQRHVLRAARGAVATTPSSTAAIESIGRRAGSNGDFHCVYNGFDPDDFAKYEGAVLTRPDFGNGTDRFRLSFVGTLWNLNSIEPVVEGIVRLYRQQPTLAEHLELVCVGRKTAPQQEALARLAGLPCRVVDEPFVPHDQAVRLMRTADALLMLLSDLPATNRIISAKVFEYMAAKRPVFLVAPEGDVCDILRPCPGTVIARPHDPEGIAAALAIEIERHRCGVRDDDAVWDISRFERRTIARDFAEVLQLTVESCDPGKQQERSAAAGWVQRSETHHQPE